MDVPIHSVIFLFPISSNSYYQYIFYPQTSLLGGFIVDIKKGLIVIAFLAIVFYALIAAIHFITQGVIPINCFDCH
ncbi:MAG: hypothetical protein P1Q69_13795, partial [Candidatus Thorarchaeota archaeon]|nr:hypothetical protein [Candidatus Thorarchaeota archaeon]